MTSAPLVDFASSEARENALTVLVALSVGLAALVMASITPALFLPSALASAAAALVASRVSVRKERPVWPAVILVALGAFSALQALPLPLGLVERLSPAAGDIWSRCLLPVGGGVRFASLSLDPAGSLFEATKFFAYGCIFYAGSRLAATRGATRGVSIVVGTGVAVAVVTLVHSVLHLDAVYGLYTPRYRFAEDRLGPFLNTNNLAGFMNLTIFAGLGLVASRRVPTRLRWAAGVALLVLMAVSFSTVSRGGLAALVIGALIVAVALTIMQRRRSSDEVDPSSVRIAAALVVVSVSACLIWFGTDSLYRFELLHGNAEKLKLAFSTRPLVSDFPWFGVGRGAFEPTFEAYRPSMSSSVVYTHPENFVAQWISEWGVLVAPFALGALAYFLRPTRLGFGRSNLPTAALVGVSMLLFQNLADLGLELPGTSIAMFALLGTLYGAPAARIPRRASPIRWQGVGALVAAVLTIAFAVRPLFGAGDLVGQSRERVRARYEALGDDAASRAAMRDELVRAMVRHPAEPYFPMVGAMVAMRFRDAPVIPWIQRALERGPHVGRTHFILAEALARSGARKQALFELGRAAEYDALLAAPTARFAVRLTVDADALLGIVPEGESGPLFLVALASEVGEKNATTRDRLDAEALRRDPSLQVPRQRLMNARLDALQHARAPCADPAPCEAEVQTHADELARRWPLDPGGPMGRARLAMVRDDWVEADRILADACKRPNGKSDCLRMRIQVSSHIEKPAGLNEKAQLFDMYLTAGCTSPATCASAHDWLGGFYEGIRSTQLALSSYEEAAREDPTAARWIKVADAAERAGSIERARFALQKARVLAPSPGIDARLEKLRSGP